MTCEFSNRRAAPIPLPLALWAVALLAGAGPVVAQDLGAAPPLTFRRAVAAALENSPTLRPTLDGLAVATIRQDLAESRYGYRVTPTARSLTAPLGLSERGLGLELPRRLPIGTDLRFEGQSEVIQQKALELAQRQLRLAELRYERGVAGNFDVIDAESNLLQAEAALIAAQVDKVLATLSLALVTGTLHPEAFTR